MALMKYSVIFSVAALSFCSAQDDISNDLLDYKIAYNVLYDKENDDYEIFVMNPDGSGKKNISNWKGVDWVYTSSGNTIYFVSDRDSAHRKYFLYSMDADGNNVRRISSFLVSDSWQGVRKNGTEFVVSSAKDHRRNELYIIDNNGRELRRLTNDTLYDADPIFSPDGNRIVFRSKRGTRFDELWMMNSDGSGLMQLTRYPEDDTTAFIHSYHAGPPFWEPNGNVISYVSNQQGRSSIFLIDPDGKNSRKLSRNTGIHEGWHSWSPDGKYLVAECSDLQHKKYSIYLMDSQGNILRRLTDEFQYEQSPVFVRKP